MTPGSKGEIAKKFIDLSRQLLRDNKRDEAIKALESAHLLCPNVAKISEDLAALKKMVVPAGLVLMMCPHCDRHSFFQEGAV